MTSPSEGGGLSGKTLLLFVLVPLFVTIVGGLAVEYLKPKEVYSNPGSAQTTIGPQPPPPQYNRGIEMQKLLTKKWNAAETVQLFGDTAVEFTSHGQVLRTYYQQIIGSTVTSYPFTVTPEGILQSGSIDLKLLNLTADELVLSWNGGVVRYKRAWYWWEIGLVGAGVVLLVVIAGVAKQAK